MSFGIPDPPENASEMSKTLFATAVEFIRSQDQDLTQPLRINISRMHEIRTPSYTHLLGHNYFVSQSPPMQGAKTFEEFVKHVRSMVSKLNTWDTEITDIVVDEGRKMCVVRASYFMKPKGIEVAVENDIVWWLWMDEGGFKVDRAMEFVDVMAVGKIREGIMTAGSP